MNVHNLTKIDIKQILIAILALLIVISTNTVYFINNQNIVLCATVLVLLLNAIITRRGLKFSLKKRHVIYICFYLLLFFIVLVFRWNGKLTGIYLYFILVPCLYIIYCDSKIDFILICNYIVKIMALISIISLFFWIFGSVTKAIAPSNIIEVKWGINRRINNYYNLYFESQGRLRPYFGVAINWRNCAVFVEAPMSNYNFCVSLLMTDIIIKKKKARKILFVLFAISIFSTTSSNGLIFLLLFITYKLFSSGSKSELLQVGKIIIFLVAIYVIPTTIMNVINQKLQEISGTIRLADIIREFQIFLANPILGTGIMSNTNGSSNSLFALLADGGILLWSFYYFPIITNIIRMIQKKEIDYISIIYFFLFSLTVVQYTSLAVLISVIYWLSIIENSDWKKIRNDISRTNYFLRKR